MNPELPQGSVIYFFPRDPALNEITHNFRFEPSHFKAPYVQVSLRYIPTTLNQATYHASNPFACLLRYPQHQIDATNLGIKRLVLLPLIGIGQSSLLKLGCHRNLL